MLDLYLLAQMWIKTQDKKYFFDCIGFEIGYHGFGKSENMGVNVYGITQSSTKEYSRLLLGTYNTKEIAEHVVSEIQNSVKKHDNLYIMPEK